MVQRAELLRDTAALAAFLRTSLGPPSVPTDPDALAARPAAVLLPIFAGPDGAPHLLFTERSPHLSSHSGQISFPGGKQDPGDASLAATALRETQEEIGLDPARVTLLGELPPTFTVVSNFLIRPQVGLVQGTLAEVAPRVNAAEVAALIDAPLAELADPAILHSEEWVRQGKQVTVYFYQLGPHRIWGATGHILTNLFGLLPPP